MCVFVNEDTISGLQIEMFKISNFPGPGKKFYPGPRDFSRRKKFLCMGMQFMCVPEHCRLR